MKRLHSVCTVPGCGLGHKARGLCASHYAQSKRGIEPKAFRSRVSVKPEKCSECDGPVKAKGLCATHYQRLLRHGHTKRTNRTKPVKICRIPGCDNHLYAKELCHVHYLKQRSWKAFGITADDYLRMFNEVGGLCRICKKPELVKNGKSGKARHLAVDHCHSTGKVRGLLCSNCNTAIGLLYDKPELLRVAADYLEAHAGAA